MAAEHIGVGATALGRASHAQDALYSQAFFALSVGFERACKLGLTIDHAQTHGHFLDRKSLKALGHDLRDLLEKLDEVGQRRAASSESRRLPRSEIHNAIVGVLTDFAKNVTRYYNLELLAEEPTAVDPIASWMERVTRPVLAVHDREHYRLRREARAASFELLEPMVLIRQTSETGEALNTVAGNTIHGRTVEFARRWERMYLLQIARFVATVLSHLGQPTNQMQVPYLSDFFRNFLTTDEFFRSKRNWSIY